MTQGFDDRDRDKVYFARSEGKYYRGARLFRWTVNWRSAAALPYLDWKFLRDQREIPWSTTLVTLDEAVKWEEEISGTQ